VDGSQNGADNGKNQITNTQNGYWQHDEDGDVTVDGKNEYLYDAEGRICAVASFPPVPGFPWTLTGYLYEADGTRVTKGAITQWSCDPTSSGFQTQEDSILGPGPGTEQMTAVESKAGVMTWDHTNVFAAGKLIASYDTDGAFTNPGFGAAVGLHFYLNDPLGTRRAQTDYAGVLEMVCQELPYGNLLSCSGSAADPTSHHFTGKERDTESGNDYFGARYYSSAMGRFLSPDWSATEDPVPYAQMDDPQSLNLYSYVRNNPLARIDADGHDWDDALVAGLGFVRGVTSSLTFGLVGAPSANDSAASLSGQLAGSLAVTHISATALEASGTTALGGLVAAPETGGASLAVEPVAGAAALVSSGTLVGGTKNVAAVVRAMAMKPGNEGGPGAGKRPTQVQREKTLKENAGQCVVDGCNNRAEHVDHAIPRSRNGDTTDANLQGMCAHHNCQKGAKTSAEYKEWLKQKSQK